MNSLILDKATRKIGTNQTPRDYLDFFISGKSLRTILNIENADFITLFVWGGVISNDYYRHILNVFRLKEKSKLHTGRAMMYVCPECGDIDCAAITAIIKDYGSKIIWSDFGYETGYGGVTETYEIEPIEFDRANYFSAFSKLLFDIINVVQGLMATAGNLQ